MKLIISLIAAVFLVSGSDQSSVEDQILSEIESYVLDYYEADDLYTEAEMKWLPNSISGESSVEVTRVELSGSGNPRGYESFELTYRNGSGDREDARIQAYIRVYQNVAVAERQIQSGEELNEDNIRLRQKDISQFNQTPAEVASFDDIAAASTLREGTILTDRHIKTPPVIESGDNADMKVEKNGLRIMLSVSARQSGAEGETIRVESDKTRKTYEAEILDADNLKWKRTL